VSRHPAFPGTYNTSKKILKRQRSANKMIFSQLAQDVSASKWRGQAAVVGGGVSLLPTICEQTSHWIRVESAALVLNEIATSRSTEKKHYFFCKEYYTRSVFVLSFFLSVFFILFRAESGTRGCARRTPHCRCLLGPRPFKTRGEGGSGTKLWKRQKSRKKERETKEEKRTKSGKTEAEIEREVGRRASM